MTLHYANVKVEIEYIDNGNSYYLCRLYHCNVLKHEWACSWRWMANYTAKGRIRQYKNGVRWDGKPPKGAKKWTVT